MKCLLLIFCIFCSVFNFGQNSDRLNVSEVASTYQSERILNYHADILVNEKGGIEVTEHIKVYSLGKDIKHGIFRTFLTTRELNGKNQKLKYNILSVTRDGQKEEYHSESSSGYYKIYIGNKDIDLPAGEYSYAIKYTLDNQIGFFQNYDELYWNVNGTDWAFPIDSISAKVVLPFGAKILQNACYTGEARSTATNCSSEILDNHTIGWKASHLGSGENLTIAVGFNKALIQAPPPSTFFEENGILLLLILSMLGLMAFCYQKWRTYGVDPPKPTIYPQFNVPDNLSPASLGYIKFENYKNEYLTASIVNLAIKGFLKILEQESEGFLGLRKRKYYRVEKLKNADNSLAKEEIGVLDNLFKNRDAVDFKGSYDPKIESTVESFKASLSYQHDKFLQEGNNRNILWIPALLITCIYFVALLISSYKADEMSFMIPGVFVYVALLIIYFVVTSFYKKIKIKGCAAIFLIFWALGFTIPIVLAGVAIGVDKNIKYCFQFIILSFILILAFQYYIKRPSEAKLKQQSLIDGFKMYMGAAENEQLKFHNSPKMTPEIFEKYLPYAMVLGVDKIWGEKFETALLAMASGYTSSWYVGHFSGMGNFGSSINSSLTKSISSGSTAPSNSSSGGSGSGGGGFSGGGGGGGGGGGW